MGAGGISLSEGPGAGWWTTAKAAGVLLRGLVPAVFLRIVTAMELQRDMERLLKEGNQALQVTVGFAEGGPPVVPESPETPVHSIAVPGHLQL